MDSNDSSRLTSPQAKRRAADTQTECDPRASPPHLKSMVHVRGANDSEQSVDEASLTWWGRKSSNLGSPHHPRQYEAEGLRR
jgi:hypothetical protein